MNFKRFSALLISITMILSMMPAVVFADETESSGIAETTVTEKAEPEEKETAKATVSKPAENLKFRKQKNLKAVFLFSLIRKKKRMQIQVKLLPEPVAIM